MPFLLDTNILSELRKRRLADPNVQAWYGTVPDSELFTSVLVIGEIRRGIELKRPTNPAIATKLERSVAYRTYIVTGGGQDFVRVYLFCSYRGSR
jgi:predicted nucleic acid-binding protein